MVLKNICANLKCHNRVYILSSKHTYQPMRACIVAQLFYKWKCCVICNNQCCMEEMKYDLHLSGHTLGFTCTVQVTVHYILHIFNEMLSVINVDYIFSRE